MPSSVTDRPNRTHESLFLLAKRERYFYDAAAVRESFADARQGRDGARRSSERNRGGRRDGYTKPNNIDPSANGGRNLRSVWLINPQPTKEAHFATYPVALVTPCILAGTSAYGCCSACGRPWRPIEERGAALTDQQRACGANGEGSYHGRDCAAAGGVIADGRH